MAPWSRLSSGSRESSGARPNCSPYAGEAHPNSSVSNPQSVNYIRKHRKEFFEQRFVRKDRVIGVVAVRAVFKAQSVPINPQVLLARTGSQRAIPRIAPSGQGVLTKVQNY
jgi:hypothetical protein